MATDQWNVWSYDIAYVIVCRDSSCEAGESELNESQEERSIPPFPLTAIVSGHAPMKRKRLRKRKVGLRKKLRTHIESVEEFNPEARDAQSAELERIRRLKLQQQMSKGGVAEDMAVYPLCVGSVEPDAEGVVGGGVVEGVVQVLKGSSSPEILEVEHVGSTSARVHARPLEATTPPVAIVIDSGSSDSDVPGADYLQGQPHPRSSNVPIAPQDRKQLQEAGTTLDSQKLCRKYDDMASQRSDGLVLVNQDHAYNETDVFLAPQIGQVAKPHQVSLHNTVLFT